MIFLLLEIILEDNEAAMIALIMAVGYGLSRYFEFSIPLNLLNYLPVIPPPFISPG
jgi:hypothetical protein